MATTRPSGQLPMPRAMREGGRQGWITAVIAGVILAAATLPVPSLLPSRDAFDFLAVWLGVTAGVYLGFALQDGRTRALGTEVIGLALFAAVATVALARQTAWLLAAGYLGHVVWDLVHHRRGLDTAMPWWYPPVCLGYDVVIAAYILIRL